MLVSTTDCHQDGTDTPVAPVLPSSRIPHPEITDTMNLLLIYPSFPDTFWSFKHALKFVRKRAAFPPLGLLTVAAMLPEDWNKRLVDTNVQALSEKDLDWADMVFISGMTLQRGSAREIIARCKASDVPVVAGGPLFASEHQDFDQVDHFVLGEAEVTLPEFLADLDRGRARRVYEAGEYPDLQITPAPSWGLATMKRYGSMSLQYSRGCPFDCDFCNVTALFGHRPRTKSARQIIEELNNLSDLGWRGAIFFVDDNLIGNKKALKTELLPALIDWRRQKRHITFQTEVSINLADDAELMGMMVEAGFDTVFIGIETPDEESLRECNKTQNRKRDLVDAVKRIQRAGIQVQGGFILGFDSDTPSIFQRQIDFIQKSGIATAMVGLLQAPPGTRLYERLERDGRLIGQSTGDNVDGTTNVRTVMNVDALNEGYRALMEQIYSPKHYYRRVKTFLRECQAPRFRDRPRFAQLMAFSRSVLHLGILGKERFQYWKLVAWTFFRRRHLLPLAITLSIYGHHFRKVTELHIAAGRNPG
jgi:radical SAM superfamily enzyme YgiQ (UPF0313 family)